MTPKTVSLLISMAPHSLREDLLALIDREITLARQGKPATLWAKMNALVDPILIEKLYKASQAGVNITLIIRGICCLRPGIKGISDTITVKSLVGRFLEHARIFCFGDGAPLPSDAAKVFISSADWMPRNLDKRVELMIPVLSLELRLRILTTIMLGNIKDTENSWILLPNGSYRPPSEEGDKRLDIQKHLMGIPTIQDLYSKCFKELDGPSGEPDELTL